MIASKRQPKDRFLPVCLALLSGVLLGCAFPPVDAKPLVWVGLVPLLWAIRRGERPRRAFLLGALAGFVFFLMTLRPLVSAHAWTGWAVQTPEQFAAKMSRQWWFLQGCLVAFAAWGSLFWGAWAAWVSRFAKGMGRAFVLAPSAWILVTEWLRAKTTFGFTWAVLGNATADLPVIRQLAAFGGVWLLSVLVVAVNAGFSEAIRTKHRGWKPLLLTSGIVGFALCAGMIRLMSLPAVTGTVRVAAVQHSKPSYAIGDFLEIGLDRHYLPLTNEAIKREAGLIMLPESIALGAMTLDGTTSKTKPSHRQVPRTAWEKQMTPLLRGREAVLVMGLDTIEQGSDHNTLIAWTAAGASGWYHKQRLVPFSEYLPAGWNRIAIRGRSQYAPGRGSQLIRANGMVLGGFICQEVLLPWVTRQSARDGATILVSGGNDGVFADPAVATVHADAAQLRAVETGRFLVRAMKTGISAIIDPFGRELERSRSSEPALLVGTISPREDLTPYVRFGDWVVWLSLGLLLLVMLPRRS